MADPRQAESTGEVIASFSSSSATLMLEFSLILAAIFISESLN